MLFARRALQPMTTPSAGGAIRPCCTTPAPTWFIKHDRRAGQPRCDNNRSVNWMPDHIKEGRMGNFLENVIDWGLSPGALLGHAAARVDLLDCGHVHVVGSIGGAAPHGREGHRARGHRAAQALY